MARDFVKRELWKGHSFGEIQGWLGEPSGRHQRLIWDLDNPRTIGDSTITREVDSSVDVESVNNRIWRLGVHHWTIHPSQQPFDGAAWRRGSRRDRTAMVDDLLEASAAEAWDAAHLLAELGQPDRVRMDSLTYDVGDHATLSVKYRDGHVSAEVNAPNSLVFD